jgi:hypothetical protein
VSSTARYQIDISQRVTGPAAGVLVGSGIVAAEMLTMIEARTAGRAVLVLSNGESIDIQLQDFFGPEAAFTVRGRFPTFQ